jgi:hypothetical protein
VGGAPRWGVCATVRAPAEQVLAFAAHHLAIGAHRVWLHFDDPQDPAADVLAGIARVTVTRCTDAYWQALVGRRPQQHQQRQLWNVTRIYQRARVDFLAHFDVDEFLLPAVAVDEALADLPEDRLILRVEPFEALGEPGLADDIFTARHFRRQLPEPDAALLARLFGPYAALLPHGMLSHTVGKCFFRTGVAELRPSIHGARIEGERVFGGRFHPDLALLHFHAEDAGRWLGGLGFRLTRGAYTFLPALQQHLAAAGPEGQAAFWERVQRATPETLAALREAGLLREAELGLRARVAALTGVTPPSAPPGEDQR